MLSTVARALPLPALRRTSAFSRFVSSSLYIGVVPLLATAMHYLCSITVIDSLVIVGIEVAIVLGQHSLEVLLNGQLSATVQVDHLQCCLEFVDGASLLASGQH